MIQIITNIAAAILYCSFLAEPDVETIVDSGQYVTWNYAGGRGNQVAWRASLGDVSGGITVGTDFVLVGTASFEASGKDDRVLKNMADLVCFEKNSGELRWRISHDRLPQNIDIANSPIRSRPAIDGSFAFYVNNRYELVCLDVRRSACKVIGNGPPEPGIVWKCDMRDKFKVQPRSAGDHANPMPSPIVVGELVYCVTGHAGRAPVADEKPFANVPDLGQNEPPSFVALKKDSGELVWKYTIPKNDLGFAQWSSPILYTHRGINQVLFPGGDGVLYGFDPTTGKLHWKFDTGLPSGSRFKGFVFSPINISPDHHLLTCAHHGHVALGGNPMFRLFSIAIAADGGSAESTWNASRKGISGTMGAISFADEIGFAFDTRSWLTAIDLRTGEPLWQMACEEDFFVSPELHGKWLYVPDGKKLVVMTPEKKPRILGAYEFGEELTGSPCVDQDRMYVATMGHLWSLDLSRVASN